MPCHAYIPIRVVVLGQVFFFFFACLFFFFFLRILRRCLLFRKPEEIFWIPCFRWHRRETSTSPEEWCFGVHTYVNYYTRAQRRKDFCTRVRDVFVPCMLHSSAGSPNESLAARGGAPRGGADVLTGFVTDTGQTCRRAGQMPPFDLRTRRAKKPGVFHGSSTGRTSHLRGWERRWLGLIGARRAFSHGCGDGGCCRFELVLSNTRVCRVPCAARTETMRSGETPPPPPLSHTRGGKSVSSSSERCGCTRTASNTRPQTTTTNDGSFQENSRVFLRAVFSRTAVPFWFRETQLKPYQKAYRIVDDADAKYTPMEKSVMTSCVCTVGTKYADVAAQLFTAKVCT